MKGVKLFLLILVPALILFVIKNQPKNLEIKNNFFSFTDPNSQATLHVGNNKLPNNFPQDLPIYPGSKIDTSVDNAEIGNTFWLTLSSNDKIQKIKDFYIRELNVEKWEINQKDEENSNFIIKKDSRTGYVTIQQEESIVKIQLFVTQ